jgi:putative transposase
MVNMKRVRRLYRLEGLQLRHRVRRRKHASLHRGIPPAASRAHERWSMDFVHDALLDGRAFRVLTVVDQWSRFSPILEVAPGLSGIAVAAALERAIARHCVFRACRPVISRQAGPAFHACRATAGERRETLG